MDETVAAIAVQRLKGVDYALKRRLVEGEYDLTGLFHGKVQLGNGRASRSFAAFNGWGAIERHLAQVKESGADVLTLRDPDYPSQLRDIPDAPLVLYRKGTLKIGRETIAIVGSRKASFEGINMAEKIAQTLSSAGITVISGLARGVDAAAHRGALKEKGKTIGVLGCGIDVCYPAENRYLFEAVGNHGCILTEYAPGEKPMPHHFPARNRIIAGLAKGVLVVEASERSGSLITARLGLEYGREVMAVPGSVFDEGYKGANSLIKQGAKLVDGIEDIMETCFPDLTVKREEEVDLNGDERYIYEFVGTRQVHIDEIIDTCGMEPKRVMAILTSLELKEVIRGIPGGFYIRR